MKNPNTKHLIKALAALTILACTSPAIAAPVPGSFTYQGTLETAGNPAATDADIIVRLYDGPTVIAVTSHLNQPVNEGRFELDLNFDPTLFDGTPFELEFLVRSPAGSGVYQTLAPRQPLTPTPYAYHANSADSLLTPATIAGNDLGNALTVSQADLTSDSTAITATRGPATQGTLGIIDSVVVVKSDDTPIGVLALSNQFPIVGILSADSALSNSAAVLGQIDSGAPGGQYALWGLNGASGNSARLGTDDFAADLTGDLRVEGNITKQFSPFSFDNAAPVAYGFVNASGTIANGTPNFTCTWNAGFSRYEIEIDNESYFFAEYVTVVTTTAGDAMARTGSSSGRLLVFAENTATQAQVQSNFQFITYRTAGAALIQGQQRPPLVPLNTPYTDEQLNPNLAAPAPRIPIIIEPTTKSPIQRD